MTIAIIERKRTIASHQRLGDNEVALCGDCVNYRSGACAYRLNSPDYPDYKVSYDSRACGNFNVPAKADMEKDDTPSFSNLPDQVGHENNDGTHDYRRVRNLQFLSVDSMRRMGIEDEQFPVLSIAVYHNGETAVFYLPNTTAKKIKVKNNGEDVKKTHVARTIPSQRYDVADMYHRVADKGVVKLQHWKRVQF